MGQDPVTSPQDTPTQTNATAAPERHGPLAAVGGADLMVPLIQGATVRYANLDHAASTPALQVVADHLAEVLPYYSSIHRGFGYISVVSTALYEAARASVARFLDARPDDRVIFTRNITDSLNMLARCVPDGGEVVVLDIEHHANLLPWQSRPHAVVAARETQRARGGCPGPCLRKRRRAPARRLRDMARMARGLPTAPRHIHHRTPRSYWSCSTVM